MDLTTAALLVAGLFNLSLGTLILVRGPKTPTTLAFGGLVASLIAWIGSIILLHRASYPGWQFGALAASYVAGAAIAATFWYFTKFFSGHSVRRGEHLAVIAGAMIVAALAIFSPTFIQGIARAPSGQFTLNLGPGYLAFVVYFAVVMAMAFAELSRHGQQSTRAERRLIALVFTGTLVSTTLGGILNVVLPTLGDARFIGWGPVTTIVMVGFMGYAIVRRQLLSVRLVGAELVSSLLLLTLLVRVLLSQDRLTRVLDLTTLAAATALALLLVRSVLREIKARQALTAANEALTRLDAAKSEFIALAGHQLRTPATVIRESASRLLTDQSAGTTKDAGPPLRLILAAGQQLTRLVDELLNLSRIEAGRIRYAPQAVRLEGVIHDVLAELKAKAAGRRTTLRFRSMNDGGLAAIADPDKLREVLLNLIDNAIGYSAPGAIVDIGLQPTARDGMWMLRFSVTDRGIGISREDLPRLFQKFTRTAEARRARPDGLGLGLYIVRRLVEDQRGWVWAESPGPGRGSTFNVEMPTSHGDLARPPRGVNGPLDRSAREAKAFNGTRRPSSSLPRGVDEQPIGRGSSSGGPSQP